MQKIALTGLFPEEICELLSLDAPFRGRQIFKWIYSGAEDFSEMTNLSKELRARLSEKAALRSCAVKNILRDDDGTVKLQIETSDALAVETVLLVDKEGRKTACVSCQAGCAMGCAFCKTGTLGLARNLSAAEIVEQFLFLEKEVGLLSNIVFMGMGEPTQNLGAIRKSIEILSSVEGRALSPKRITISTCGITRGIYEIADEGPKVRLALSLTSAEQNLRETLMPTAKANPLSELKAALAYYSEKTGFRATLEVPLLAGKNSDEKSAKKIAEFARALSANVNVIAWNEVEGLPFSSPSREECDAFLKTLRDSGANATLRRRRGSKIAGACGQLGSKGIKIIN